MGLRRTRHAVITASAGVIPWLLKVVSEIDNQNAVRVGDTDQHQHPHQRHNVQCAVGERQDDQHADKPHGNCQHDQEGINERFELRRQDQEQQEKRNQEPEGKALKGSLHALDHPAQIHTHVGRNLLLRENIANGLVTRPRSSPLGVTKISTARWI